MDILTSIKTFHIYAVLGTKESPAVVITHIIDKDETPVSKTVDSSFISPEVIELNLTTEKDSFWSAKEDDSDDTTNISIIEFSQTADAEHTQYFQTSVNVTTQASSGSVQFRVKYISVKFNNGYAKHTYCNKKWAVQTSSTCLIEGTQVLMSDDSYKSIEKVRSGDMLKSWDFINNEYIDVRCFAVVRGFATDYKEYKFDNGKSLIIHGAHGIFDNKNKISKGSGSWKIGDNATTLNGEFVPLDTIKDVTYDTAKKHYTLISENGIYFANDIMCSHTPSRTLARYKEGHFKFDMTAEDVERMQQLEETLYKNLAWSKDSRFKEASKEIYARREPAKLKIVEFKQKLAARDYKTIKYLQNDLPEAEWQENIEICKNLRAEVNNQEAIVADTLKELRDLKESLGFARCTDSLDTIFRNYHEESNNIIRNRKL